MLTRLMRDLPTHMHNHTLAAYSLPTDVSITKLQPPQHRRRAVWVAFPLISLTNTHMQSWSLQAGDEGSNGSLTHHAHPSLKILRTRGHGRSNVPWGVPPGEVTGVSAAMRAQGPPSRDAAYRLAYRPL